MAGERISFYMDEHVPSALTGALRQYGVDIVTAQDVGLVQTPDEEHLEFAFRERRVLISQDRDFLRLNRAGYRHSGIAYARQRTAIGVMLVGLMLIYEVLDAEYMIGRVEYI